MTRAESEYTLSVYLSVLVKPVFTMFYDINVGVSTTTISKSVPTQPSTGTRMGE